MDQTSIPPSFYDSIMMLHSSSSNLTTWPSNTLDLEQQNFWHNLHGESYSNGPGSSFHVWLPECQGIKGQGINRHMQCSHVDQCWAGFEPGELMNMDSVTRDVWSKPNTNIVKKEANRRKKTCGNILFQQTPRNNVTNKTKDLVNRRDLANIQERQRMHRLNDALDRLRKIVPMDYKQKRVSKIQILHGAIAYIRELENILEQK